MKEVFYRSPNLSPRKGKLNVHSRNTIKLRNKSLDHLHTDGTNSLPEKIK